MATLDLGPTGISIALSEDGGHLADAAELEKLGYDALWLPGGQLRSLEPVADLVRSTQSVRIGTAIIPLDVHGDTAVASTYADLDRTDPGRFVVGLGGPQQGPSPMRAMNGFLDRIEAAAVPIPQHQRILAALGPKKLALARERFGGAIALLVAPDYTAGARAALGADPALIIDQVVIPDTDADRARTAARRLLGFLLTVPGYRMNALRMGFSETEIDHLDARLVDALVVWGDLETIAARVSEHRDAGADHVVLNVLSTVPGGSFLDDARDLASALGVAVAPSR